MMRRSISFKLALAISSVLLVFALTLGIIFMSLFRNHTFDIYRRDMLTKAEGISSVLSEIAEGQHGMMPGGRRGFMGSSQYASYIRFLNDTSNTDAWILDEDLNVSTTGSMNWGSIRYENLPPDAEAVVASVFQGQTTFSEGFGEIRHVPTLTVGIPILSQGQVVGALLLHAPVEGIYDAVSHGSRILIYSLLIALALTIGLSIFLSMGLTRPLKRMKDTTIALAEGDYEAKTHITREDEIGELAGYIDILSERLYDASLESQRLEQLRSDFIANITHELRTPVTVLRGSLEAIQDKVITDPALLSDYQSAMLKESRYLERLVNDLLDLSRLQNLDFKMEMEEVNVAEVLQDAMRSARLMAKEKELHLELHLEEEMRRFHGDYQRLRQMLLILLDNAVKFSREGGAVSVTLSEGVVRIRDHGVGIPKEELPNIFTRFYKSQSEENKMGTGLGLAIAKGIADRHGIRITVDSTLGEGTEFRLLFPWKAS